MNRKIPLSACLVLVLAVALLTFQIVTVTNEARYNKILQEFTVTPSENPKLSEIAEYVEEYYVNEIDSQYLSDALTYGYVLGLKDPYATYFTSEAYREFITELQGSLTGIGIRITLDALDDIERIVIFEVMDSSPAEEAGLLPGDIIYSVEGELYSELGYEQAVDNMLGEEGTVLRMEVLRGTQVIEFSIERRSFDSQLVSYKTTDRDASIGYIRIYEFGASTVSQFKNAVEALRADGVTSLIFDVRNNPGGELNSITNILDYLLPEGDIIITRDKNGNEEVSKSDAAEVDMPMVVLANESTASAAELFTASLRDYDKAYIIGNTTYGKGTVQQTFPLSDGSAVKFSTHHYLPPSGESYDGIGISPDLEVELSEYALEHFYLIDESEDAQLIAAIDYLLK